MRAGLDRKETIGENREGHESLAGWRIVGGGRLIRKAGRSGMVVLISGNYLPEGCDFPHVEDGELL